MHAVKTKKKYGEGFEWKLTDDIGLIADAEVDNIIYDVDNVEDLKMELDIKRPAAPGFSFFGGWHDTYSIPESDQVVMEDSNVSDEAIFAAAREYGSVRLSTHCSLYFDNQSHKNVPLGDFVLYDRVLEYNPKKAKACARKSINKEDKNIADGNPNMDMLRVLSNKLYFFAFCHYTFKQLDVSCNSAGSTKAITCQDVVRYARLIHTLYRGRDEWRKNKEITEAIEKLIPYAPGMRKRAKKEGIEGRWWNRLAIFLEHEQRELNK